MAPPKKDAFSDLFQASLNGLGRGGTSALSMLEQQRLKASRPAVSETDLPKQLLSHGVITSRNDAVEDIFAIFDKPSTLNLSAPIHASPSPSPCLSSDLSRNPSPAPPIRSGLASEVLLLHDDFTDLCVLSPPHQNQSPQPNTPEIDNTSTLDDTPPRPVSSRDGGLALLFDMGFSMSDASDAWDHAGPDIQACAEYLVSRLHSRVDSPTRRPHSQPSSRTHSRSSTPLLPDALGSSIFSTANKLFAKSKQAVLLNIEQLAQPSPRDGVPPWMRSANRYGSPPIEDSTATESELLSKEEWLKQQELGARTHNKHIASSSRTTRDDEPLPPRPRRPPVTKSEDPLPPRPRHANPDNENALPPRPKLANPDSDNVLPPRPRRPISRIETSLPQRQRSPPLIGSEIPSPSLRAYSSLESNDRLPGHPLRSSKKRDSPLQESSPSLVSNLRVSETPRADPLLVPTVTPVPVQPQTEPETSHDLLGLNEPSAPASSTHRDCTPLDQFQRVDYDTAKLRAHASFLHGNYADALIHYSTCMQTLPPRHELRIVIGSNLANVHKLLGELKQSLECVETAISLIGPDLQPPSSQISGKPIRYWLIKLLTCRAEVSELLERFPQCLQVYDTLVKEYGVRDKKVADARARVHKIVNPQANRPRKAPRKPTTPTPTPTPKPISASKDDASLSFEATERIAASIDDWSLPKKDNLRLLLVDLNQIVPSLISLLPKLRNLGGTDVTLPKQVKAQYLRVISAIHPDKLALQCKQDPEAAQLGHEVFIILSLAWDKFRAENDL